jgi:CheY-like chemotaxis protein
MSRILVVDDTANSRETLATILRGEGYDTDCARNGAEGLVRLKAAKPDLILLDHMMPEVDGLTFLASIRRFPKWKDLPVIMFTGSSDKRCHNEARKLGVREYFVKASMKVPELLGSVKKHVASAA